MDWLPYRLPGGRKIPYSSSDDLLEDSDRGLSKRLVLRSSLSAFESPGSWSLSGARNTLTLAGRLLLWWLALLDRCAIRKTFQLSSRHVDDTLHVSHAIQRTFAYVDWRETEAMTVMIWSTSYLTAGALLTHSLNTWKTPLTHYMLRVWRASQPWWQ